MAAFPVRAAADGQACRCAKGQGQCRGHRARGVPIRKATAASWGEDHRDWSGSVASSRRPAGCVLTGSLEADPGSRQSCRVARRLPLLFSLRGQSPPQGSSSHMLTSQQASPWLLQVPLGPCTGKLLHGTHREEGLKGTHPSLHGVCWRANLELTSCELITNNSPPCASQTLLRR